MVKRLLSRWRRPKPRSSSRTVIELLDDSGGTIIRFDLPTVVEEDDDGLYPLVQAHDRNFDPPLPPVHAVVVSMRHRTDAPTLDKRING